MTGPRHLWSGDWEDESEAAARRRRAAAPLPEPAEPDLAPPAMNGDSPAPVASESPFIRPAPVPRQAREPLHIPWRPVGIAVLTALVVIGVALGLNAIFGGGSDRSRTTAKAGWLGVRLGVLPTGAVVVTGVEPNSPARSAGIRSGDVITEVQGRPVAAPVDVALAVDALTEGERLEIGALRGSRTYTTQVKLTARPSGALNRAGP